MMIAVLDEPELVSVTEEKIIPLNPFINKSRNKNKKTNLLGFWLNLLLVLLGLYIC